MTVTFLWPTALWLLPALVALIAPFILLLRRRRKTALRYASLQVIRDAMDRVRPIRSYVSPLVFLMGLVAALLAVARPMVVTAPLAEERTVIVAIDVSLSMAAVDVQPTRLAAAQSAAKAFVRARPPGTRLGIIAISMHADLVQAPTSSREDAIAAIERLEIQEGSGIGSGVVGALITIFSDPSIGADYDIFGLGGSPRGLAGEALGEPRADHEKRHKPVPPGSHSSAAIVLLTDGDTSFGVPPLRAANIAAQRGVRVHPVGVGTAEGATMMAHGRSVHAGFNEKTLKTMADMTAGQYFHVRNTDELKEVYRTLSGRVKSATLETEITALFTAISAALLLLSGALSLLWSNRLE